MSIQVIASGKCSAAPADVTQVSLLAGVSAVTIISNRLSRRKGKLEHRPLMPLQVAFCTICRCATREVANMVLFILMA